MPVEWNFNPTPYETPQGWAPTQVDQMNLSLADAKIDVRYEPVASNDKFFEGAVAPVMGIPVQPGQEAGFTQFQ